MIVLGLAVSTVLLYEIPHRRADLIELKSFSVHLHLILNEFIIQESRQQMCEKVDSREVVVLTRNLDLCFIESIIPSLFFFQETKMLNLID